jgi:hypothetical protein
MFTTLAQFIDSSLLFCCASVLIPPPSLYLYPYLRALCLRMLLSPLQLLSSSMSKLAEIFKPVMIFTHRLSLSAFNLVPCLDRDAAAVTLTTLLLLSYV